MVALAVRQSVVFWTWRNYILNTSLSPPPPNVCSQRCISIKTITIASQDDVESPSHSSVMEVVVPSVSSPWASRLCFSSTAIGTGAVGRLQSPPPPPIAAVFDQQPPLTYRYVRSEHGKDRPIGALYWLVSYVRILPAAHLWTSHRPQWVRSVSKYLVCFDINKLAAVKTIFSNIYLRPSDCCKYV